MYHLFSAAAAITAADQILKKAVEDSVPKGKNLKVMNGPLTLRKVYNRGAAFNMLDGHPELVKKLSAFLTGILAARDIWLCGKRGRILEKTGMALLTGGAFSNMIDRLVRGKVVDYLAVESRCEKISKLTFNLGDVCIAAGALLAVICRKR